MRGRPTHVAVVIPARDEEHSIADTLGSVRTAVRRLPADTTTDVIIVADACTDTTADRARVALDDVEAVVREVDLAAAGAARRVGTEVALARSPAAASRTWIASTDADTLVPPTWLTHQLRLARAGAVAVAGVVDLRFDDGIDHLLLERFVTSYGRARSGMHPHVHGANLGFRGDAYLTVGGWSTDATGEDVDLWNRLRRNGRGVAVADLRVQTSARLLGRAPAGFADDLTSLRVDGRVVGGRVVDGGVPA